MSARALKFTAKPPCKIMGKSPGSAVLEPDALGCPGVRVFRGIGYRACEGADLHRKALSHKDREVAGHAVLQLDALVVP